MHAFDVAAQAVAEALRTGQIGTPVAARVVAALTADHGRIERQLARILEACAEWLGSRPDQRLNEEIRRRTRVAGLFSNEASALRLVCAVLMEISEDWETNRRYLTMGPG